MKISPNGLIQLTIDELLDTPVVHLVSGVDLEDLAPLSACGRPTTISGYTEWGCLRKPALSLGWDWCVRIESSGIFWKRMDLPRTNIMLVDGQGNNTEWTRNLERLAMVVDALPWVEKMPQVLAVSHENS